jgi:hypothetical protein
VTDTSITIMTPPHAAGPVNVVVLTPGGNSPPAVFHYVGDIPAVTSVAPPSGSTTGGNSVVITGSGFVEVQSVSFGPNAATYIVNSDTQITALSPAHAVGTVDVTVTTLAGTSLTTGTANDFAYVTPTPVVTSLSPNGGPLAGGTTVVITGNGFTGATSVSFGGTPLAPTAVTDTSITVVSPARAVAGTVDVLVTTPGGTSANTAADNFTYGALPVVTSVSPTTGGIAGGTIITVTGSGFTGATSVSVGGTAVTPTNVTDTSLTVVAPAHVAGVVDIIVTTPTGVSANTAADNFAYSAAPFVTAITPTGGPVTGGTTVTITGSGLTGATAVSFGGTSVVPVVTNDTTITAVAPAHAAGTVDVIDTTPLGVSANTTADNYTYGNLAVITGVNPATGPIAGGTTITLTGTGFTGATLVTFGDVTAVPTNVTDTSLTVVTPAHAAGAVNILVTTPVGISTSSAAGVFTYGSATTTSYTLFFRWSLIVWNGANNIDIMAALKGQETPDNTATNDVSSQVTAIFRYNNALQKFEAFFPGTSNVPGANDFTVFNTGTAYWIAIAGPNSITWTIVAG